MIIDQSVVKNMHIVFYKYQGTGNDFIILDNRNHQYNNLHTEQVKMLCNRHFGVGADGLILLSTIDSYDFEMKYYNADGNQSSMCGNGGRCIVQFAYTKNIIKNYCRFMAIDGEHEAFVANNEWVKLKMKDVTELHQQGGDFILNTGSPHYVTYVQNIDNINVVEKGRKIRYNKTFKQHGINVNFVEKKEKNIYVRTYERGVENETLSCGTGVTASAITSVNEIGNHYIQVNTPGGKLVVEFNKITNSNFNNIWLCGPAVLSFTGNIHV